MNYLSKEKSLSYLYISTVLFITNILMIIVTFNNPLTKAWLSIFYIIGALLSIVYLLYIFIKTYVYNEEIDETSKEFKIYDFIAPMVVMTSIIIMIFGNVIVSGKVDGRSMEQTLHHNQDILIYKFNYVPKIDDVIIISRDGSNGKELIIKRVIAVPGDKISFKETIPGFGFIFVNDTLYQNRYLKEDRSPTMFSKDEYMKMVELELHNGNYDDEVTLSKDYYIALGDNFNNSSDSRHYGAFHISQIGGKMIFKFGGRLDE